MKRSILIILIIGYVCLESLSANFNNLNDYVLEKIENSPSYDPESYPEVVTNIDNSVFINKKDGVIYEGLVNVNLPNLVSDRMMVNDHNNGHHGEGNHGNGHGNGNNNVPIGDGLFIMLIFSVVYRLRIAGIL